MCLAAAPVDIAAADKWTEVTTPNFLVVSNASESSTRRLAWQFEQVRTAIAALFAWARVDLERPVTIIVAKDEPTMKMLGPQYWEQRGGLRPASFWMSGPDQHYLVIRADQEVEDRADVNINPFITAYYAYVHLILQQSVPRELPMWFMRGFSGVLSNTIVRSDHILFGPPIPWHLEELRAAGRLRLGELIKVTDSSPELKVGDGLRRFDAKSWAFVHFLMFADKGARRAKLNQFTRLVSEGTDAETALRESFGDVTQLDGDFVNYISRPVFTYFRVEVDASVKRESFPARALQPDESHSVRARLLAAMGRAVEARAAIADARKAKATASGSYVAEGMLFDREGKEKEAEAAYSQAVAAGTTSGYAYYRVASLRWRPDADKETLAGIEKLLLRAVTLNPRHPQGFAYLGEVRSLMGGEGLPYALRAIKLAPSDPRHRLTAARILMRKQMYAEAVKHAQDAIALAETDEQRREAQAIVERAKSQGGSPR
jgi:tetratricopeptide (TPR) repeat protein